MMVASFTVPKSTCSRPLRSSALRMTTSSTAAPQPGCGGPADAPEARQAWRIQPVRTGDSARGFAPSPKKLLAPKKRQELSIGVSTTMHLLPFGPGLEVICVQEDRRTSGGRLQGPVRVYRFPGVTVTGVPVPPWQVFSIDAPAVPGSQSLWTGGAVCWKQTVWDINPEVLETRVRPLSWLQTIGERSSGPAASTM